MAITKNNTSPIVSNIELNDKGQLKVEFINGQYYIFAKENFTINRYQNNQGLCFTKGNKTVTIKMVGQDIDAIINAYNGN